MRRDHCSFGWPAQNGRDFDSPSFFLRKTGLLVLLQDKKERSVVVVVVQTPPQACQSLLPIKQVLRDPLTTLGCTFERA